MNFTKSEITCSYLGTRLKYWGNTFQLCLSFNWSILLKINSLNNQRFPNDQHRKLILWASRQHLKTSFAYLLVHCDGFRLILTSKYFQLCLCLSHTLCLSAQFSQPIRESSWESPWFRLLHSAKMDVSPIPLVFTVHSVHLLSSFGNTHLSAHPRLAASTEIWKLKTETCSRCI